MHKPAVSIGMPVYNGGDFLRQALKSILSQSFSDFELIISDNASVDDTEAIVSEFQEQDDRIRHVRQSTNIGPIANFNYVLSEARADCFIWAAADDLWDEDWIKVLFSNMSESVAISFGHVCNVDGAGRVVRTYNPFDFNGPKLLRMIKYYFAEDYNGKANIIYGMYHTRDLRNNGMREKYNGCYFGVDMLFVFDWLHRGFIINDTSVLLYKRIQGSTLEKRALFDYVKNSLFMLDRMKYILLYAHVANGYWYKALFLLLFPVKYIKSFLFNLNRVLTKR
jgi:glycosyltransferase involved in cell wall biosynthesis